jgi:hypothetical protein
MDGGIGPLEIGVAEMTTTFLAREYLVTGRRTGRSEWVRAISPEAAVVGDRKGMTAGSDHQGDLIECWCGDRVIRGLRAGVVRDVA